MQKEILAIVFLGLLGCANEPGRGWAKLQGEVHLGMEGLEGRRLADGAIRTSAGYAVSVDSLELTVGELEFTNEAAETALVVHLDQPVSLLRETELAIGPANCGGPCVVLEKSELTGVGLMLVSLVGAGTVRDPSELGRLGGEVRRWEINLPLEGDKLAEVIDLPIDGDQYSIHTQVSVRVASEIFDAIDWRQTTTAVTLGTEAGEAIRQLLLRSHLEVTTDADHDGHEEGPVEDEDTGHGHAH